MAKISWIGVYEDYCIVILVAAFFTFYFTLVSATFSSDYTILVSTNDYNEHWIEVVAFGIAIPGIIVQAVRHFKAGGNTRIKAKP